MSLLVGGPADRWTLRALPHTLHQPAGCPVSTGWMDTLHTTHCHSNLCPPARAPLCSFPSNVVGSLQQLFVYSNCLSMCTVYIVHQALTNTTVDTVFQQGCMEENSFARGQGVQIQFEVQLTRVLLGTQG